MNELRKQTQMMRDEMDGIRKRITRVQTIADIVQPSTWNQWKDPNEALRRLKTIYQTLPKEYKNEKSDLIESEIARAMNLVSKVSEGATNSFNSGKEMEKKGANSSPGVAQKLTASGVGTLISIEAQTQVIQSHIVSLLTQTLAEANEKESRMVMTKGSAFQFRPLRTSGKIKESFQKHALTLKASP